jgi:hypothetical protein
MTERLIREIVSGVEEAFEEAQSRIPRSDSWGFYACDDGPAPAANGSGPFCWFENREKMCEFLRQYPLLTQSRLKLQADEINHVSTIADAVRKLVSEFEETKSDKETAIGAFNNALQGIEQISWWGTLQDLISSDHPFAEDLRQRFQSVADVEPSAHSPEFIEFLQEYDG